MNRSCLTLLFFAVACTLSLAQEKENSFTNPSFGFIENRGQVKDQYGRANNTVLYTLPLPGNSIHLKANGFSYDTYSIDQSVKKQPQAKHGVHKFQNDYEQAKQKTYSYHRVDVEFIDANADVQIIANELMPGEINFWTNGRERTSRQFKKIIYKNIYPNIDVEFIARPGASKPIEYDFIVHPGGDINKIKLNYRGANSSKLVRDKLNLKLGHGTLVESIPASYWQKSKERVNIRYKKVKGNDNEITLGFEGKANRKDQTLVIDPTINQNWTYLIGNLLTDVSDIVSDNSNNVIVVGVTSATSQLATSGAYQTVYAGLGDAFVMKFSTNSTVLWATYYGGDDLDEALDVDVDPSGNIVIVGATSSQNGIASSGVFQGSLGGDLDGFIAKFSSSGSRLWATYYGGSNLDYLQGISVSDDGRVFVSGGTQSADAVLATSGTHQTTSGGYEEAIIAAFSSSGSRLWGSFFGGAANDASLSLAVEKDGGGLYVGGNATSTSGIATSGAHQTAFQGFIDGFLAKFNPSTGTLIWSTYLGGSEIDDFLSIALDNADNIYGVGQTNSTTHIATSGSHQPSKSGTSPDAFIVKFNSSGVRQWGTYYGGTGDDIISRVAVDPKSVYVTGGTSSSSGIATTNGLYPNFPPGNHAAFLAKFRTNGVRLWGSYTESIIGGPFYESAVAVNTQRNLFQSTNMYNQTFEFQLTKYTQTDLSCRPAGVENLAITQTKYLCATQFSIQSLQACASTYSWDFGDGNTLPGRTVMHSYQTNGTYNVTLNISWGCNNICEGDTTITQQVIVGPADPEMDSIDVEVVTDQRTDVLAASASTFSDTWSLNYFSDYLDRKNGFANGSQGVWRNDASFAYKKPRKLSPTTTLASDGTFVLDRFNWQAMANAIPGWIEATTMTHYSPFSYELENKDVLDVYSAAVYDYGGHLVAANGANMRFNEMAFTGFEYVDGTIGGNWILGTQAIPSYTEYKVGVSRENIAVVEASLADLTNVTTVSVVGSPVGSPSVRILSNDNAIVCMVQHPENSDWTLAVLKNSIYDRWTGKLKFTNQITPATLGVLDNTIAHTGKKSLKVTADQVFSQNLLTLIEGKSYWINCWASVNNASSTTPTLAGNPTIEIIAKAKNHQVVQTSVFTPSGPLIEGWQQIKGSFTFPANAAYIEIKFDNGTAPTVWFDDLRLQPENGNMKGYVYDLNDYRLKAVLDEENFASFFFYDQEGNLYLTKKETIDGVKTISENISYTKEIEQP